MQTADVYGTLRKRIHTFVHSNFNYGCLIWHFSFKKSQNKVKTICEMSLQFLSNDYWSSYVELLEKSTSVSMETIRLRTMVYETFKTLKNLNPVFMKDIVHYSANVIHKKHNLYIHTQNIQVWRWEFEGSWCNHMEHIAWIY